MVGLRRTPVTLRALLGRLSCATALFCVTSGGAVDHCVDCDRPDADWSAGDHIGDRDAALACEPVEYGRFDPGTQLERDAFVEPVASTSVLRLRRLADLAGEGDGPIRQRRGIGATRARTGHNLATTADAAVRQLDQDRAVLPDRSHRELKR